MKKRLARLGKSTDIKKLILTVEYSEPENYFSVPIQKDMSFDIINSITKKLRDLTDDDLRDEVSAMSVDHLRKILKDKTGISSEINDNSDITVVEIEIPNSITLLEGI